MYQRLAPTDARVSSPFDTVESVESIDPTEELELDVDFGMDMDDLPTVDEDPAATPRPPRDLASSEVLSASLPVNAAAAYQAFCDTESIPRWLSVVHSVRVLGRTPAGRAARAAFVARLQNSAILYLLFYRYDDARREVSWGTAPGTPTLLAGRAQFVPLGERATLMEYQLVLELPDGILPPWEDPFFSGHATSVVMNDFRDYVIRMHRSRA